MYRETGWAIRRGIKTGICNRGTTDVDILDCGTVITDCIYKRPDIYVGKKWSS